MLPTSKPALRSRASSLADMRAMSEAEFILPTDTPYMRGPTTAARSWSSKPVSRELRRGMTATPRADRLSKRAAVMARAFAFSASGTESSISGMKASGIRPLARSNIRGWLPGTNSRLRSALMFVSSVVLSGGCSDSVSPKSIARAAVERLYDIIAMAFGAGLSDG